MKSILSKDGRWTFVKWSDTQCTTLSGKLVLNCEDHGDWETRLSSLLKSDKIRGCPQCSSFGFNRDRPATVYVIYAVSKASEFTGYGISGHITRRMREHSTALSWRGFEIEKAQFFCMSGDTALDIETALKRHFPLVRQDTPGFQKEATYGNLYEQAIEFITTKITERENANY